MSDLLFRKVDYTVGKLLEDIAIGDIGLPDIQRPFVWDTARVRDLFDSMYRGYPVGTLLFWENDHSGAHRAIGVEGKQKPPHLLIVDGQQRLTALYAVMKGEQIVDKDFRRRHLRIAFNPCKGTFEVTNTAIERDVEWIADIGVLWQSDFRAYSFISSFLERLGERRELNAEDRESVSSRIQRLVNLINYPMTALEISLHATEEEVSEIFVRINSQGRTLNQADFILTLMSVFWDEGRKALEEFARRAKEAPADNRPSPYNPYFKPAPDQLLRVDVAYAFRRARMEDVCSILRGKDLQTREFSEQRREEQFQRLREVQVQVLDLQHWHDFLKVLHGAGYGHPNLITSENAIVYTYALWLIGRRDLGLDQHSLRKLMARWFFMSSLTGRYTTSPETRMDQDLALLRNLTRPEEFVRVLEQEMSAVLTTDYWDVTLPNELVGAAHRNRGQAAFYAALCILDAPVLYSSANVRSLLDPLSRGTRASLERHHLFPRQYLKGRGITGRRDLDQVANFALVEWHDNNDIRDQAPHEYAPVYESRFDSETLTRMYEFHALPQRWYEMAYEEFLTERRKRMAAIIRRGFEQLSAH